MSRLSKIENYSILWLDHIGFEVSDISKELKISEKSIVSVLEKQKGMNNNKIKTGSGPTKKNKSQTLMINETAVKKNKSVSVMTGAASQQSDEVLKNMKNKSSDKNIFRPYNA